MATNQFVCPECGASVRSAKPLPAGTSVRCPKCSAIFKIVDGDASTPSRPVAPAKPETATPRAAAAPPSVERAHPRPVADERDEDRPRSRPRDDEDDRPRSRRDDRGDDYDRPRSRRDDRDDDYDRPRSRRDERDDDRPRSRRDERDEYTDRPRGRRDDDDYDRPRNRRDERDEDDDRPARRKRKKGAAYSAAVMALVAGVALLLIGVGALVIGMFLSKSDKDKNTNNAIVFPPGSGPGMFPGGPQASAFNWSPHFRTPNDTPEIYDGPANAGATDQSAGDTRPLLGPPTLRPTNAGGEQLPPELPAEQLTKVKRATVYIRVTSDKGLSSGSGFFATGATGMVVTNAHVVGMLEPGVAAPKQIDVVLNSGENDEATFRGEVLTVDRASDLAVVRIHTTDKSKNAATPDPLTLATNTGLRETQPVFISGFPLGEQLGKNITVVKSTITSLRKSSVGELDQVQVGGGMHPGNSGGPVVDANGNIVGVAVAVIRGTMINFAIPAERVNAILEGRLSQIKFREPALKGKQLVMPVEVEALDPLQRIKDLTVDWWWGDAESKVLSGRITAPGLPPGSTPRQSVAMTNAGGHRFTADIAFPANVPLNKVMWFQPHFTNGSRQKLFAQGIAKEVDPSPELKPATVMFRPQAAAAKVHLKCTNHLNFRSAGGEGGSLLVNLESVITEQTQDGPNQGGGNLRLATQEKFEVGFSMNGNSIPPPPEIDGALKNAKQMGLDLSFDRYGSIAKASPRFDGVPEENHPVLSRFAAQLCRSLDFMAITFPNAEVRPGQRWRAPRQLPVITGEEDGTVMVSVEYIYRGTRQVNGREMAVVAIAGTIQDPNATAGQPGSVSGTALVDIGLGSVVKVNAHLDAAFTHHFPFEPGRMEVVQARAHLDLRLTRQ